MDFLNNLSNIFSNLFVKKNQSVLGVDIGSSAIKVVQIKKKHGRAVLETYGELALGPYAEIEAGRSTSLPKEKLVEALKDILREAKTTTTEAGVALPIASSLITFISVPPVTEKQLPDVISLEARKYIPVPMSEVMFDYSIIPQEDSYTTEDKMIAGSSIKTAVTARTEIKPEEKKEEVPGIKSDMMSPTTKNHLSVLVVAIHNEYVNNYQAISLSAGLQTNFYEIELFSSIRSVIEQGIQSVMIMDMGAQSTKLYIVERGVLRGSHIVNRGSQDITLAISKSLSLTVNEAENAKRLYGLKGGPEYKELTEIITVNLDYIFYESNAVLLSYQKKFMKNISKVILTGGGVLMKGFIDLAKVSFQTEVAYANPFAKLETPAILAEQFDQAGPEFAVAIGCALRRLSEVD